MSLQITVGAHGIAYTIPRNRDASARKHQHELLQLAIRSYGHLLPRFQTVSFMAFGELIARGYDGNDPRHKAVIDALIHANDEA